ncbi:MAG: ABC transporter permease [Geminicoccaceae bacterium]|nr:ABC transporter permease [Geminicoccaceae bacterium]
MLNPIPALVRILSLVRKEMLTILKDPKTRTLLFAPALFQTLLFGYGATFDLNHAPYALLDLSGSRASADLVARLDGSGLFERVATLENTTQIADQIDSGNALLVLTFGSDFAKRLATGNRSPLQVILDGRNSATAALAAAAVASVVAEYNAADGNAMPLTIVRRAWFNPNLESRWNILPALIATLSMMQTLLLSALSVAREREQGTFDQLLVTPLTPFQILIGKALPPILIGLAQSTIILLVLIFWFRIPMSGSVGLMFTGILAFTTASVGIGLSISALSLTMQQAMLYTFMIIMPLILLSGLLTPVRNMPEALQFLTLANPLRFAIDLVRRVYLEGAGFGDVGFDLVPMLVLASITLPLASWLFRHRLG